jgi:GNAT superfamily N-acetyltransferase
MFEPPGPRALATERPPNDHRALPTAQAARKATTRRIAPRVWRASSLSDGHDVLVKSTRKHGGSVEIVRFAPEHEAAVRRLILEGLEEHWGVLDPRLNPDLEDIAASYAEGTVLVARDVERIVGVGAIVPFAADEGEVKRMSVARGARRQGVGTALLLGLLADAKARGWRSVRLETTADWEDAVQFYGDFGFEVTHYEDSCFGRDAYFRMDL